MFLFFVRRKGIRTQKGIDELITDAFILEFQRFQSRKTLAFVVLVTLCVTAGCVACPELGYY